MTNDKVGQDESSGAKLKGDAKLTLPNGEIINLPFMEVKSLHLQLGCLPSLKVLATLVSKFDMNVQDSAGNHFIDIRKLYSG